MPTLLMCLASILLSRESEWGGLVFRLWGSNRRVRTRRICFRLYPFSLKVVLRNSPNSARWLVGLVGTGLLLELFTLEDATQQFVPKCRYGITTAPCLTAERRAVLNPHILRQSLPTVHEVRSLATNQYCFAVGIKFSSPPFHIAAVWCTSRSFTHRPLSMTSSNRNHQSSFIPWFMHDRHLNFFRWYQFNQVHTNITYMTNELISSHANHAVKLKRSWQFIGILCCLFWLTIRLSNVRQPSRLLHSIGVILFRSFKGTCSFRLQGYWITFLWMPTQNHKYSNMSSTRRGTQMM
jgi:hypothetical protein